MEGIVTAGFLAVILAIIWLGRSISGQFRRHDADLRGELEQINEHVARIGLHTAKKKKKDPVV